LSLFAELKRRNVFRVAVAYLALGWIVTQVTATVGPMLNLPPWVGPVVLWIGAIGLPFALLFAWIYELTPEGLKRESEVDRSESVTRLTARRLDLVVIGLLVVAIGLFALREFGPVEQDRLTAVTSTKDTVAPAPATTRDDRSVAVLPFVDMSAARDQEYFADGISEEVLNLLAQVPQLRVIARTSSFSFKGKDLGIAEIAETLNVANVLEGSVRKSGDKLRITAQLVRASDSSHLWSQTYDRELTDVFAVQDEIAAAVVEQLKVTLLGGAPKARATNPQAYALFLQAQEISRQYNAASLEQAIALYRQALTIDPAYAPAWNGLAGVYFGQMDLGLLAIEQGVAVGLEAVNKALEHDPTFAPAYGTQAAIMGLIERDYPAAARQLEKGLELDPMNLEVISVASAVARRLGRMELAIALGEYILSRDPVNVDAYELLAISYRYVGRLDDSIAAYRTLLSLTPGAGRAHWALANVLLQKGDAEAALAEYRKEALEFHRLGGLAVAYHALGRKAESDAAFTELTKKYPDAKSFLMAIIVVSRGDSDGAFGVLERAARQDDIDLGALAVHPAFAVLHKDPRWLPLLRRLGMAPEQLATVKFDVTLPE
jgi:TolB-like protein/Tfp pilus assembly protein PilF